MNLYYTMISPVMRSILSELMLMPELSSYRLVGGTNLALQLGHRLSVDIDLFAGGGAPSPKTVSDILANQFRERIQINRIMQHGMAASIDGIKIDIYDWKVPFLYEPIVFDGIRLATIQDIFAFKCEALMGRKAEKDFVDLAEISQHHSMNELFTIFKRRYPSYTTSVILAILLKPELFERDLSIQYAPGKSWEEYVKSLLGSIAQYENEITYKKKEELKYREEHIRELIEQKRKNTQKPNT